MSEAKDASSARSAVELAASLGDLPDPAELPHQYFDLVTAVRELAAAVVATDMPEHERGAVARMVGTLTERLNRTERDPVIFLARHADGRLENLSQAGSGRLNPQAPPLLFDELPATPPKLDEPIPVEVRATFTPTAAHLGPPGKLHGGVVATVLDEVLGVAATAAGASGLTAGIDIRYKAATPGDKLLEVTGRFTHRDGRKAFASGEVRAGELVTATATAVFISAPPSTRPATD